MSDFLHRFSTDAQNAFSDIYSNYILGDDAGKSARLTMILKPKSVAQQQKEQHHLLSSSAAGSSNKNGNRQINVHSNLRNGVSGVAAGLMKPKDGAVSMSQPSKLATDATGGLTFLEINGRAYVKTVQPNSPAALAGVLPQDTVQYATLFKPEWAKQQEQQLVGQNQTNSPNSNHMVNNGLCNNFDTEEDKKEDDHQAILASQQQQQQQLVENGADAVAAKNILDLESQGMRISYDELRHLMLTQDSTAASAFLSPPVNPPDPDGNAFGPPIPSTVNVCIPRATAMARTGSVNSQTQHQQQADGGESSPATRDGGGGGRYSPPLLADTTKKQEIVFVFRRTRQRNSLRLLGTPSFRIDDECDFAASLVKRLAPTADMEVPPPDTWEELVHDGTDWLLGSGSIFPPKQQQKNNNNENHHTATAAAAAAGKGSKDSSLLKAENSAANVQEDEPAIPLDEFERERQKKLASLRSRMANGAILHDRTDDAEAATIRGMIQKAVGLAFVRASKIVLGVSLHSGSGVVISRLSDGTWSAPSAIGTWGLGLGLQFGLEVAEYIFILQTNEALDHFRRGGSFTVGGNIGAAVAGLGREAYGAASVGGSACGTMSTVKDDEYNDSDSRDDADHNRVQSIAISPIVAYAKSQGLYVGVSLEGSRIFSRDAINARTYKFSSGRDVSAYDILSGSVQTPPEAEELYAALHSVEFTHEMSCLPRPPEVLRKDSSNAWLYDRSTLSSNSPNSSSNDPFAFLKNMDQSCTEECEQFETQFKQFLYGGVSVQRLLPDSENRGRVTRKERRTLWLMLPEVGSLRLGFVSKLSDGENDVSNKNSTARARRDDYTSRIPAYDNADVGTVGSEEVTLDSALNTKDGGSTIGHNIRTGNVQLSNRYSVALTDVTVLSQEPQVPVRFKGEDMMEHLRVISIQDVSGTSLLFLANNFREAELLVCGLKLLLEKETARLGVRGGLPLTAFGSRGVLEGTMSPSAARGFREKPSSAMGEESVSSEPDNHNPQARRSKRHSNRMDPSQKSQDHDASTKRGNLPEGRRTWGNVPGRNYMRGQAATLTESKGPSSVQQEQGVPRYVHGCPLVRAICKNVKLPLPLPLSRVLLLDSTSPVIKRWETDRGDNNFMKTRWAFPPATPRELERHASEHQLIASGSMCGASRTSTFDRPRYGSFVRLSETHTVEADDSKKLTFTVTERNPRRGFSIKVRILLRAVSKNASEVTVLAEIRPVGKDMSNQAAVHKACQLILDEIQSRYGCEQPSGLLQGFLSVVDNMAASENSSVRSGVQSESSFEPRPFPRTEQENGEDPTEEERADYSFNNGKHSVATWQHNKVALRKNQARRSGEINDANTNSSNVSAISAGSSVGPESSGLVSFEDMLKNGKQTSADPRRDLRPPTPSPLSAMSEPDPSKGVKSNRKVRPLMNNGQDTMITTVPNNNTRSSTPARKLGRVTPEDSSNNNYSVNQISTKGNNDVKKDPVLIEVKPLPKIRLSLMPSPREEDEEENSSSSSSQQPNNKKKKNKKKKSSTTSRSKKKYSSSRSSSRKNTATRQNRKKK